MDPQVRRRCKKTLLWKQRTGVTGDNDSQFAAEVEILAYVAYKVVQVQTLEGTIVTSQMQVYTAFTSIKQNDVVVLDGTTYEVKAVQTFPSLTTGDELSVLYM